VPLTELVGRQLETAQVAGLLTDRRLVTLVGAGGIGKTRLSLAVGAAVADRFDDGVVFVPLAEATTPALVVAALAAALELAEVPGQRLIDTVAEYLAEQSLLLVVDNFEQVQAAAPLVSELLAAAPGVSVLLSSRERLGLYGEQAYPVPPLPLPDAAVPASGPAGVAAALASSPALALFHARARAAAYDFALTPDNLGSVVELCRRLDGLPLAIELAAAHIDALSPAEMVGQLRDRLDLPGDGPRDLPARQRTLRGAIDWSFTLLDPPDRELFVRLGVFSGGCRADAARALAGTGPTDRQLAERLQRLADRNLLQVQPAGDDGVRYTMLYTIHSYAVDQLAGGGLAALARRQHADHYAALAERAEQDLTGPEQGRCATRVEQEYQNLRSAFGWALDNADPETAARIGLGLWRFWRAGSHLGEGRAWLDRLLTAPDPLPDAIRARVLHAAAVLAGAQDEHETATALASESWLLARGAGDDPTAAQARNALGIAALAAGDYPTAGGFFANSLAIWQGLDAPLGVAIAHGNLAKVAMRSGDVDAASEHATRCLELDQRQGNTRGVMLGLLCLGEILLIRGDTAGARTRLTEAMTLSRTLGDVFGQAMALHQLGGTAQRDGDLPEARRLVAAALELRRDIGDREDLAISLETLAGLLAAAHPAVAARLLATSDALRRRYRLPPPATDTAGDTALADLRSTLAADILAATCVTAPLAHLDTLVDDAVELASQPPS
jgi:predicted ATPase/Tfp pilus assembly protein PilF